METINKYRLAIIITLIIVTFLWLSGLLVMLVFGSIWVSKGGEFRSGGIAMLVISSIFISYTMNKINNTLPKRKSMV